MNSFWANKEVLITGGTGSLGSTLTKMLMKNYNIKGIRIFSRDELKQWELRNEINRLIRNKELKNIPISYLIGDIRDLSRISMAMNNVDIVIHTAAMKQIPACEYNPFEAVLTNIIGTKNVIEASIKNKPQKVMLISTDKANTPLNFYGATKMCAEKLFLFANVYTKGRQPIFSCCRYGNVLGSRGSIIPLFKKQIKEEKLITITSPDMTRFWITLSDVVKFIIDRVENMHGAEIYIPKMPSSYIIDIVDSILKTQNIIPNNIENKIIGLREGEKLHEVLINKEESSFVVEYKNYFIITRNKQTVNDFQYSSDRNNNRQFLTKEGVYDLLIKSGEIKNNEKY